MAAFAFLHRGLRFPYLLLIMGSIFLFPTLGKADQRVEWVKTIPQEIYINQSTPIYITTKITPDPSLIPTSVNLFRIDNGLSKNLGSLYDDGTHGDSFAKDSIFTSQIIINEPTPNPVIFRVSVAYKGTLKRLTYDYTVYIKGVEDPEEARSKLVKYLRMGDLESAISLLQPSSKNDMLKNLNGATINRLADGIEGAQIFEAGENYRTYQGTCIDQSGAAIELKFKMILNQQGQWKTIIW